MLIYIDHCNGSETPLEGSGTFSPVHNALLLNKDTRCDWTFSATPKQSYGIGFDPLVLLSEDSFVNIYELADGERSLLHSFQGMTGGFIIPEFITSCNPLETELISTGTQPYCWGIIPPCERGFNGFYCNYFFLSKTNTFRYLSRQQLYANFIRQISSWL